MSGTELMVATDTQPELARDEAIVARAESTASREVESAVIMAKRFPRNEDAAFQAVMRTCKRKEFAKGAEYVYERGGKEIRGASVVLARELARAWGNIRYGFEVVHETEETRRLRGYAWDVERNSYAFGEAQFSKLIQRKVWENKRHVRTDYVVPDERELRELTSKQGSILVRNALMAVVPSWITDEAREASRATRYAEITADPEGVRKAILKAYDELNVTAEMLEEFLGHPVVQCSPHELEKLRGMFVAIKDQGASWQDFLQASVKASKEKAKITLDDVKAAEPKNAPESPETSPEAKVGQIDAPKATKPRATRPAGKATPFRDRFERMMADVYPDEQDFLQQVARVTKQALDGRERTIAELSESDAELIFSQVDQGAIGI